MRKIILAPYQFEGRDYQVKESLSSLLFIPGLSLTARQVVENDRLACKIERANGSVLLEEAEYETLKRAVEAFRGYSRADLELVTRVLEAPEIGVVEDKHG
jgi:hypothetical protein